MIRLSALARHPLAVVGVVVATASAVVFITLVIAMLAGMLTNPYAGLVVFIGIPAVVRPRVPSTPARRAAAPRAAMGVPVPMVAPVGCGCRCRCC